MKRLFTKLVVKIFCPSYKRCVHAGVQLTLLIRFVGQTLSICFENRDVIVYRQPSVFYERFGLGVSGPVVRVSDS